MLAFTRDLARLGGLAPSGLKVRFDALIASAQERLGDEYAKARVPMLPLVIGNQAAARVILAHTVALVALSLLIAWFGLGWIYLTAALLGGGFFIYRSIQLVAAPGPEAAMRNFHASLVQLSLLLLGAVIDGWLSSSAASG